MHGGKDGGRRMRGRKKERKRKSMTHGVYEAVTKIP